jgi:hypothetical protein
MDVGQIILVVVVVILCWFLWVRFVVPLLTGTPFSILILLVPALVAIVLIIWLLTTLLHIDILHVKVLGLMAMGVFSNPLKLYSPAPDYRGEHAKMREFNIVTRWFQLRLIVPSIGFSFWRGGNAGKQVARLNYPSTD